MVQSKYICDEQTAYSRDSVSPRPAAQRETLFWTDIEHRTHEISTARTKQKQRRKPCFYYTNHCLIAHGRSTTCNVNVLHYRHVQRHHTAGRFTNRTHHQLLQAKKRYLIMDTHHYINWRKIINRTQQATMKHSNKTGPQANSTVDG